jgi:hypothetical protein
LTYLVLFAGFMPAKKLADEIGERGPAISPAISSFGATAAGLW